jgi:Predicted xylanase/chitin deacetylase
MEKRLVILYIVLLLPIAGLIFLFPALFGNAFTSVKTFEVDMSTQINQSKRDSFAMAQDKKKGDIVFVLDDGYSTVYTNAFEIFKKHGIRGSVAVIANRVGQSGYLSLDQLSDLYVNGWDLLNHTYSHDSLPNLSPGDQAQEFNLCRDWLSAHHFNSGSDIAVFPDGLYNIDTFEALQNNNYTAARSLDSLWSVNTQSRMDDVLVTNLDNETDFKSIQTCINTVGAQGTAVIFVLHKIEDGNDPDRMNFSSNNLEQVLNLINDRNYNLQIVTLTELIKEYS